MENRIQNCPLCHKDLAEAAFAGGESYCECGWSSSKVTAQAESKADAKRATQLVMSSVLFTVAFSGMLYLTSVAGQIFVIKQKISFGMASPGELQKLSDRCLQLGDEVCALQTLKAASLLQPEKLDLLLDLARFQMQMSQFEDAAVTYKTYIEKGGQDADVVYRVGKALALAGHRAEAQRYYEAAMQDTPGSINLNAAKGLVRLYIEDGRLGEAKVLIAGFKEKTRNQSHYFSDELKMIEMASVTN